MTNELRARWTLLGEHLRARSRVLVAFSGGCDSVLLAAAAGCFLGRENVLLVTAVSPSLAQNEKFEARHLATLLDLPYLSINTEEMQNPNYVQNPSNRCFYCKDELFARLAPLAGERGMVVADGFNASDRSDIRPGRQAADARNVCHPLNEADLDKHDIRVLSRWLKLPTWNKPASPCLSSRIPYGTPVTVETLRQIERAEAIVRAEGFRVVRVRHYGSEARVEVPSSEIRKLAEPDCWNRIDADLRAIGYERVRIEPEGFRSGRLNNVQFS